MSDLPNKTQVERFLRDHIDSVPQLEALLLIWRQNPRLWTCEEMARELYVSGDMAFNVLAALLERNLIAQAGSDPTLYALVLESEERKQLLAAARGPVSHSPGVRSEGHAAAGRSGLGGRMSPMLEGFLSGAVVTASLTCSLFFIRFWRRTAENLFLAFAVAFFVEAATRTAGLFRDHPNESIPWFYLVRIIADLGIVYAIVRKNYA